MIRNSVLSNFPALSRDMNDVQIGGVADGSEAFVVAQISQALSADGYDAPAKVVFVARDATRLADIENVLSFINPTVETITFPAWDCLPYDRVSPSNDIVAKRMRSLSRLVELNREKQGYIVLTTANAITQKVVDAAALSDASFTLKPGQTASMDNLMSALATAGFERTSTVREPGEYAVRGGILDVFVSADDEPIRLDFFGDELESIRAFDAATQMTTRQLKSFEFAVLSEVVLDDESVARFRRNYISEFGAPSRDDALYNAVISKSRFAGMEHWLPFFHEALTTLSQVCGDGTAVVYEHMARDAVAERFKQVEDHYDSRTRQADAKASAESVPYKPIEPSKLYLSLAELDAEPSASTLVLSPFEQPPTETKAVFNLGIRPGRSFSNERADDKANVFEAAVKHIHALEDGGKTVVVSAWTDGSLGRLNGILAEHGLRTPAVIEELSGLKDGTLHSAVLNTEHGFETDDFAIIAEQDVLGDRIVRHRRRKKGSDFIAEVSSLSEGDLVVHVDHGIGRFEGLKTIEAMGAPHDCLELHYASDGRLFLPVENIELLSRYGSDVTEAQLDKLGGVAWQARKAKLKKRLLEMAEELIRIAAERTMRDAPRLQPPAGLYDEFSARFPYEETEDQAAAIDAVVDDLGLGRPMDRLVCGDVGFGKTEVALRAAFVAALNGVQVAVVVPTTLLARQHFKSFSERFHGLPINVGHASRLAGPKALSEAKAGFADGSTDIVVGTHALLGERVKAKNLGLLIVDEEQHFGVKHKEKLKQLKADVHVLTLSATPIPRTLQLALTGVRELSLITTPPVDRLAVRTFVSPFDTLIIRETLMRERYRGGQSFYVCPRISDLDEVKTFLDEHVPELRVVIAHGQMPPGQLEDIMNAFYDGKYDVLLSTTIVESGLDIPTANTLVVHRADMFGLAQLYQLRGRVGRSKLRAYALFTLPANKTLTKQADRRLKVLQSLDTLGAGFQLASHDLDIRGGGNLLGEEQSGHIKEVGFELYQQMLEEAVAEIKGGEAVEDTKWSPQIAIGTSTLIPESYVPDLNLRLSLYRRMGDLTEVQEIDALGAELVDRFGPLPEEVEHLLKIVYIKALCRKANVEKVDAGPKGAVVAFRNKNFANPAGLVQLIGGEGTMAKIRPDQTVLFTRNWQSADKRLAGTAVLMTKLAKLAEAA
ncbi:MAG: transcription-repair coupling factor [Pseudomonadota bacterium]